MRAAVITVVIAVPLVTLLVAGCAVGEYGSSDAGNGCAERITPPGPKHLHTTGGGTNAGMGCVAANCHLASAPGPGAPPYQFGGTVYKPGGTIPQPGVTVRVRGKSGMIVAGVTDEAGNFSIPGGALPDPFPAQSSATACPTTTAMVASLSQGGGNCNSSDCHGGTAGPITLADP
jgi:hypothetical protein